MRRDRYTLAVGHSLGRVNHVNSCCIEVPQHVPKVDFVGYDQHAPKYGWSSSGCTYEWILGRLDVAACC